MHKLTRSEPPTCLKEFRYGSDNWRDLIRSRGTTEIWQQLNQMQQQRCAYCEMAIKTEREDCNAHVEHFRQRSNYPRGTFEWENIFGSCNRLDSCGKFKDSLPPYDYRDLLKMDDDDPEAFLLFLPDGKVVPRDGLNATDQKRAEETIRIFNLNGSLRQIRKTVLKGYLQTAEEIAAYAQEYEEQDWLPLLQQELEQIKDLPNTTAIKHLLQI